MVSDGIGVFFIGLKFIRWLYSICELVMNDGLELVICGLKDFGEVFE